MEYPYNILILSADCKHIREKMMLKKQKKEQIKTDMEKFPVGSREKEAVETRYTNISSGCRALKALLCKREDKLTAMVLEFEKQLEYDKLFKNN